MGLMMWVARRGDTRPTTSADEAAVAHLAGQVNSGPRTAAHLAALRTHLSALDEQEALLAAQIRASEAEDDPGRRDLVRPPLSAAGEQISRGRRR
jgi:hypothetical protein